MGILNWLRQQFRDDRAARHTAPAIVANYWGDGVPEAHPVKDISITGAYLYDTDRWPAGTVMTAILREAIETAEAGPAVPAFRVSFRVIRHGPDGMGVCFILPTKKERLDLRRFLDRTPTMSSREDKLG